MGTTIGTSADKVATATTVPSSLKAKFSTIGGDSGGGVGEVGDRGVNREGGRGDNLRNGGPLISIFHEGVITLDEIGSIF